jgi:uncharacterized integral membrane protein (TIGR00698 family)
MTVLSLPAPPAEITTSRATRAVLAGLAVAAAGLGCAMLAHRVVPAVGVLTWAVTLGVVAANLNLLPKAGAQGLGLLTKKMLRVGIVLLGFSVSLQSIAALGLPVVGFVAATLVSTLVFTTWLGRRLGLSPSRALLVGTGFSICGASAIAAMEGTARADEEDVTVSIAMVTLFGTLALVVLPVLAGPLGLTDLQFGVWAGASVHEVGQVVAAASPLGAAVVATAVVVKLTRVVMLAPVVATVSVAQRLRSNGEEEQTGRPPLVPLFVLGFLACAGLRSIGAVDTVALSWISQVQVAALGAALFGMGASVKIPSLLRKSGPVMVVSTVSTLFIGTVSLLGVLLLVGR